MRSEQQLLALRPSVDKADQESNP
ncbi:MAG: hypothetical protein RLZZ55_1089, partial [Bacteroidota bacterium]